MWYSIHVEYYITYNTLLQYSLISTCLYKVLRTLESFIFHCNISVDNDSDVDRADIKWNTLYNSQLVSLNIYEFSNKWRSSEIVKVAS